MREASAMCESGARGGAFYRPHALAHDSLFALALRFPLLALKTKKKIKPVTADCGLPATMALFSFRLRPIICDPFFKLQ